MKKIGLLFLISLFVFSSKTMAQFTIASDNAGNYSSWSNGNNLGFGFNNWDLWQTGTSGWFIGSAATAGFGNIDTNSKSFGLWGNPSGSNFSNAQRVLTNWSDGASFSIDIATAFRNGSKGIDLFATGFEQIWNFNIGSDKYTAGGVDQTSWAYSQTSIFKLTAIQSGTNIIINLERGSDTYTTTINNKTLSAFKLYCGSTNAGSDLNNLFFNNLKISYSDWSKVPSGIKVEITSNSTLNSNKSISDLVINTGVTTEISETKQLTVTNSLTNNGTLNLLSDASGTATILTPATISGSGTANVNQYLSSSRSWYMTSPLTGSVTPSDNNSAAPALLKWFDESKGTATGWTTSSTMTSGVGYLLNPGTISGASTLSFSGTLNAGNQTITLTSRTGTADKAGFNLVGNPFPAYLDWKLVCDNATNADKMRSKTMWYRTKTTGFTFHTVNGASGEGSPSTASRYIPPMQAFWVRAAESVSGSLAFNTDMRANAPTTDNLLKAPASQPIANAKLRLEISNGLIDDETLLYFNANALNGLDAYDSPKLSNDQAEIPEIYTMAGSELLAINGMSNFTYNQEIPLGFVTGELNSFSLKVKEASNFDSDVRIFIKDNLNLLQPETEITNGSPYTFNSDITNTSSRFSIIFRSANGTTGCCNQNEYKNILVYKNANNQICIDLKSDLNNVESIAVYNTMGQKITETKATSAYTVMNVAFEAGVYFVKLNIDNKIISRKVIIK